MRSTSFPMPTAVAAALLAAAALTTGAAQAGTVTAEASGTLGMSPAPGSPYSEGPVSTGSVDILEFHSDFIGNSIGIHTFGAADGSFFGSRSSAEGLDATSDGTFTFSDIFTNTTGAAGAFDFVFTVIAGEVSVTPFASTPDASDSVSASYVLDINIGGADAFDSAVSITSDSTGITQTRTGIDLNTGLPFSSGTTSDADYFWGAFVGSLPLGLLAPGESVSIDYTLSTSAAVEVYATGTFACGGGGFGGEGPAGGFGDDEAEFGFEFGGGCSAIARIGDPLVPGAGGNSFQITAVPAPAGLALLVLGLAGIGFGRRKQHA